MQCHLHLGSAIEKLCTKQQKQRSTYVIFSNNYVFYLPLRQLEPGKKYKYVSASPGTNKTEWFPNCISYWGLLFLLFGNRCSALKSHWSDDSENLKFVVISADQAVQTAQIPWYHCTNVFPLWYCQQGGSKSMECSRVSAVIDWRVQLILPVRTACVTFAHQSSMEICCGLCHSSTWGIQHHCWRTKCYPKVCSLQVGQAFFSGQSLLAWMNSAKNPRVAFGHKLDFQKAAKPCFGFHAVCMPDNLQL